MSEVGLVPFEESQNSPLFQNNEEDAKHAVRLVSARETENRILLEHMHCNIVGLLRLKVKCYVCVSLTEALQVQRFLDASQHQLYSE